MADARENKSAFGVPLIVSAAGFGLAAALMAFVYLKSEKAALVEKYAGSNRKEVTVLVAAKDLPKGTVVTVTNLANGKSTFCVVGDRGAFRSPTIIDLDASVFAQIAPLGAGRINVAISW